jgi:hypothetical protein
MHPAKLFSVAVFFLVVGCVTAPESSIPDPTRQPWRDSGKSREAAKAGDAVALRKFFAAAKAQLMLPYVNGGEDAEGMSDNMKEVLTSLGDERFAGALYLEDPETRSAVREFLWDEYVRGEFPRSFQILVAAPDVEWPSDKALQKSYLESGQKPPKDESWGR